MKRYSNYYFAGVERGGGRRARDCLERQKKEATAKMRSKARRELTGYKGCRGKVTEVQVSVAHSRTWKKLNLEQGEWEGVQCEVGNQWQDVYDLTSLIKHYLVFVFIYLFYLENTGTLSKVFIFLKGGLWFDLGFENIILLMMR